MSYEKYIIQVGSGVTIALKYNLERKEVIIGGLSRFTDAMNSLMTDYYSIEVPPPIMVQANKLKFVFSCAYKKHREAIALMKEHGIYIATTTTHGNIMR